MAFFEPLRQALRSYAAGVHEVGPPADPADLREVEQRLGLPLPSAYRDFLLSFNGAGLFSEMVRLYGTKEDRLAPAAPGQVRIGETPDGALWMDQAGAIRFVDEAEPDPIIAGSELERWLAATLAREGLVVDREGDFRAVLDEEGGLLEPVRWKRARLGRRHDPGAALYLLEEAELLFGAHRDDEATERLHKAVARDPGAGPAWELLGALHRQAGRATEAEEALLRAAEATFDPWLRASRLLDAARAAPSERRARHAAAAVAADPGHADGLLEEAEEALAAGCSEEADRLSERLDLLVVAGARPDGERLEALRRALRTRQALRVIP